MKKIFLEGMPCVGKTTIIQEIRKRNIRGIHTVDEIILKDDSNYQDYFMNNDLAKINKYKRGTIIIDRGLISTLSYNMALKDITTNDSYDNVIDWFNKYGKELYKSDNVITYYLKSNEYILRYQNQLDPYGSVSNQKKLEEVTINNIKKYCLNYKIIDYKFNDMEDLINEIIN